MNNIFGILLMVSGLLISACTAENLPTNNSELNELQACGESIDSFESEDLSYGEKSGLIFMREEEKLARDVYNTLYAKWGKRVFSNIAQSEQRHTDAIKSLLIKYEIDDPVETDVPGSFANQDLQDLYDTLIVKGDSSLIDALQVGALIEEVDIADIQKELDDHVDNEDIVFVYDNLLHGSYNHLRAFVRNLSRMGINYEPQILTKEQFDGMVNL